MSNCEYCELWWSGGYRPQLTIYGSMGAECVPLGQTRTTDSGDPWDALHGIITELGLHGWELVSAGHHSGALFFKRHLQ